MAPPMFFAAKHAFARCLVTACMALVVARPAQAQLDPVRRDLLEFGYDKPLQGHVPFGGYAFYYLNRPTFGDADHSLTVIVSPYLEAQFGIRRAFGTSTDLAVGVDGGGFADTYNEIRGGRWVRDESFIGHGVGTTLSAFHLFNPGQRIPLNAVATAGIHELIFERYGNASTAFTLPRDQPLASLRAGLRAGGVPPALRPEAAGELSVWYEGDFRLSPGAYGIGGDRRIESSVHLFWTRGLVQYTLPSLGQQFSLDVDAGTSVNPDRLSAYRIGGMASLAADFPLLLPGYQTGELSARSFALGRGAYLVPLDAARTWRLGAGAGIARIAATPGVPQAHRTNRGVDLELDRQSDAWKAVLVLGHGFDAMRDGHRGANSATVMFEFDLERLGWVRAGTGH